MATIYPLFRSEGAVELSDGAVTPTYTDISDFVQVVELSSERSNSKFYTMGNTAGQAASGQEDIMGKMTVVETPSATEAYNLLRAVYESNEARTIRFYKPDTSTGSALVECDIVITNLPIIAFDASSSDPVNHEIQFIVNGSATVSTVA